MTTITAEREIAHIGESKGMRNHDHDMIHELSRRLDVLWRLDQYSANAEDVHELRDFWQKMKKQEEENVRRLKQLVAQHCKNDCF